VGMLLWDRRGRRHCTT